MFVKVKGGSTAIIMSLCVFVHLAADRCYSPTTLLEGKRRIVGVVLRANSEQSNYLASEVRYDDDGWCSAELGGDIFYPYLEVEFGQDVLFHAVVTKGFSIEFLSNVFLEQYQIEIAGKDEHFRYVAVSNNMTNSTVPPPAVCS